MTTLHEAWAEGYSWAHGEHDDVRSLGDNPYPEGLAATLPLSVVLRGWTPGDEWSWAEEFARLDEIHSEWLAALTEDVRTNGITLPIDLGHDGRMWDGHHRLCVAVELGLKAVPVRFVGEIQ